MTRRLPMAQTATVERVLLSVISALAWWETIEEPERCGFFARIIRSKAFEALRIIVIFLNGLFIMRTANHEMQQVLAGLPAAAARVDMIVESLFTSFYLLEMVLRIYVHRLYFFCNGEWKLNTFDLVLVLFSGANMAPHLMTTENDEPESTNVSFLRILRVFKITKLLRIFRFVHFVSDLRIMVESMRHSLLVILWCVVPISFVLCVFAVFFVQSMANFLAVSLDKLTEEQTSRIQMDFGSVEAAILSLFQAITGGDDWRHFYETISYAGPWQSAIFLFFITFFVVAAWNIVTSTFVEKTTKLVQPDMESLLLEKRREILADGRELLTIVRDVTCGRQSPDRITLSEFMTITENDRFVDFLHVRGLDIKDAEMFFSMLASASGTEDVELNTFVAGCLRMKGLATSIDLHALSFETKVLMEKQRKRHLEIEASLQRLDQRLAHLVGDNFVGTPSQMLLAVGASPPPQVTTASASPPRRPPAVPEAEQLASESQSDRLFLGLTASQPPAARGDDDGDVAAI